jgi:GNAT superfamily N-acetyltransferase
MHKYLPYTLSRLPSSETIAIVRVSGCLPGLHPIRLYWLGTGLTAAAPIADKPEGPMANGEHVFLSEFLGTQFCYRDMVCQLASERMNDEHARRLRAASRPRRARLEDTDRLARLLTKAFLNDPVIDWLARSGPERPSGLQAFFLWLLYKRAIPAGEVWMSDDGAACALWMPPGIPAWPPGLFEQLKLLPLFLQMCGFGRIVRGAAISGDLERAHPREMHFYLSFMAVDPPLQGIGLGSAILGATLRRIDEAGMPAYLENSSPRNTPLYERGGFVVQKNILPEDAPPLISMLRKAR